MLIEVAKSIKKVVGCVFLAVIVVGLLSSRSACLISALFVDV